MITYLLTITCQQKSVHVTKQDLEHIIAHLIACGVRFKRIHYENHGLYAQLHVHTIVQYAGRYSKLTKYGDQKEDKSFQIHWSRIGDDMTHLNQYLAKQDEPQVLVANWFRTHYFNQDTQRFQYVLPGGLIV